MGIKLYGDQMTRDQMTGTKWLGIKWRGPIDVEPNSWTSRRRIMKLRKIIVEVKRKMELEDHGVTYLTFDPVKLKISIMRIHSACNTA